MKAGCAKIRGERTVTGVANDDSGVTTTHALAQSLRPHAYPRAHIRIMSVGCTATAWTEGDSEVNEALQRLDWRGVLAVASADTANNACTQCAKEDVAIDGALELELSGRLTAHH